MNSTQLQLAKLERDVKSYKSQIDLGRALDNLRLNRDFKKLITEGFLKDEAVRLVLSKADPALQTPEAQAGIDRDINAIAVLNQFFTIVSQKAAIANKQLNDADEMRTELLAEEGQ